MRSKLLDSIFKTRMDIRFVSHKSIKKIISSDQYQIVQVNWDYQYRRNHLLFSTHFTPNNFVYRYKSLLDSNRKIVIFGNWRRMTKYYRILDSKNYKVYLVK